MTEYLDRVDFDGVEYELRDNGSEHKAAYAHSKKSGNPHGTTASDIGYTDNKGLGEDNLQKAVDTLVTAKVSVADIVNDLVTDSSGKPLSAAQGVVLKKSIEGSRYVKDSTAEILGLGENATADDALVALKTRTDKLAEVPIGDTLTTTRTDLDDKWALCNGDVVYRDGGIVDPELYEMLDEGFNDRALTSFPDADIEDARFTHLKDGKCCAIYYKSSYVAAVCDFLTGELIEIAAPVSGHNIIGIAWNGSQYVMCTIYSNTFYFYTSDDLQTWTQAATHTPSTYTPNYNNMYGVMRFVWDGAAYRVAAQYSGYQTHCVYTYDSGFNYESDETLEKCDIYATDGLFCISSYSRIYLYEPGSTTRIRSVSLKDDYSANDHCAAVKYAENQYVLVPVNEKVDRIAFYDKSTNTASSISASKFKNGYTTFDSITRVHFDRKTNEFVLVLYYYDSGATTAFARVAIDADKSDAANYTVTVNDVANSSTYRDFVDIDGDWIYLYSGRSTDTAFMRLAGAHPRTLPTISQDKVYTYIKVKEGG